MTINLYNGSEEQCGITTSGGTESILTAVLAHREWAKQEKGITKPNIVACTTAHAALDKACFYFNVELRKVPTTPEQNLDIKEIKRNIDSNTIMLYGSAPEYAFGKYDDIPALSDLAISRNIGLHSDCCLGGFVNPFMEDAGYDQPFLSDFRVRGVTSISCDPHKYGYGPKGLSILMFRKK